MNIKSITIKNVKGLHLFEFKNKLYPNLPAIFVANNGFGKTSFATAMSKLKQNRISLEKKEYHKLDLRNKPEVIFKLEDNLSLVADCEKNEIKDYFDIVVLNSRLTTKNKKALINGFTVCSSEILIEPIIITTIPNKVKIRYNFPSIKENFGKNSKILENLKQDFESSKFLLFLNDNKQLIEKLYRNKTPIKQFYELIEYLNTFDKTKIELKVILEENYLKYINDSYVLEFYDKYKAYIKTESNEDSTDLLDIYQLIEMLLQNKNNISKVLLWNEYSYKKDKIYKLLDRCNGSWINDLYLKKETNKLVFKVPDPQTISNGERDLLSLIAQLSKFYYDSTKKDLIFVIDELFDYLDPTNLLIAQYFIVKFINELSVDKNIYPIIMTHLNPSQFNTYTFNKKHIYYLDNQVSRLNKNEFKKIFMNREKETIKESMSKYFLHFNPEGINLSDKFNELGIVTKYTKSTDFKNRALDELKKYISGKNFNPLMVSLGLRLKIEEKIYNALKNDSEKKQFIVKKGVLDKLIYAERCGVIVPEIYFVISHLYNDLIHLDTEFDVEAKINAAYQYFDNNQIKKIITSI